MKVSLRQLTNIFLRMSECLQREGIRYGGRCSTRFNALKQSNTTSTNPTSVVCTRLTLTRSTRWIAISPRSSPLYALAVAEDSEKDPIILLRPLAHSSTNAAEHRCGCCHMYDPSVTTTSDLSWIALATHSVPPSIDMCSQSHVHPHLRRTYRKEVGGVAVGALRTVDITRNIPGWISSTEHISPISCRGRDAVFLNLFNFLTVLEYTSIVSDP